MSKYTLELWEVIELGYNIFDFEYSFYNNDKKTILQNNFIQHYNFHEIGSETIERFKIRLKTRWNEVIEKYSIMFEANERLKTEIDILTNYQNETTSIFNDTPKGEIIFDDKHATNYTKSNSKGYAGTTGVQLMKDYNENFVDIQEEFFKEFSNIFMQIF